MKKVSMKKRLVAGVAGVAILSSQFLSVGAVKTASATQFAPISGLSLNTSNNDRGVSDYSVIPAVTSKTVFTTNIPGGSNKVNGNEIQVGKTFVHYSNVAYYNGKNIDLKITIADLKYATGSSSCYITFNQDNIGIMQDGFINVRYKHEFFINGTNTPIELPTIYTFGDIDVDQRVIIDEKSITGRVFTNSQTGITYARENGKLMFGSNSFVNVEPDDRKYFVSVEMKTSSVEYDYSIGERAVNTKLFLAYHGIDYRSPKKTDILKLRKSVQDKDESGASNTLENAKEAYTYHLQHTVHEEDSSYYFKNYQISDKLPDALNLGDIKVVEERSGLDVTNKFDIKKNGNSFVATLINPNDARFYGKSYAWTIKAQINETADLTPYKDASGNIKFTNTAKLVVDDLSVDSDKVVTTVLDPKAPRQVALEKSVDKTSAKPEEVVTYGLDVMNNTDAPVDAVVTDDLKQLTHTDYVIDSITIDGKKVTDAKDTDNADITNSVLTAKFDGMKPKQKHHIEFKVKLSKAAVQGDVIKNIAKLNDKNSNAVETIAKVEQPAKPTPAKPTPTQPQPTKQPQAQMSLPETSGADANNYFGLYLTGTVVLSSGLALIHARKRK